MKFHSPTMRRLHAAHMGEGGIHRAMLRCYDEGMTYKDLAAHFNLSEGQIEYWMPRFLAQREEQEKANASPVAAA